MNEEWLEGNAVGLLYGAFGLLLWAAAIIEGNTTVRAFAPMMLMLGFTHMVLYNKIRKLND